MSGVVKGVKKVFKKVAKVVKKIIKPLAIAAAVYFTAGVAMSYIPATQAFAASLPGFASAGVAGGGVLTTVATKIGLGGGLAAGAATANVAAASAALATGMGVVEAATMYGAGAVEAAMTANITANVGASLASAGLAGSAAAGTTLAASAALPGLSKGAGAALAANVGGSVGELANIGAGAGLFPQSTAAGLTAGAAKPGMTLAEKMLIAKTATDLGAAAFGPTPQEIAEAEAIERTKFRGAFFGMDEKGQGGHVGLFDNLVQGRMVTGGNAPAAQTQPAPAASVSPEQRQLLAGRKAKQELFPTPAEEQLQPMTGMQTGPGQMHQQIPVPTNVAAPVPNVRYV